jgi:hypothetical protein
MQDPERPAPKTGPDLSLPPGVRFASLEPMPRKRATGDVRELPILGRMVFTRMPDDVQSFWQGNQAVSDSPYTLEIVCDVVGDRAPGAGHEARLVAMRLCQLPETLAALGLINGCRSELHMPRPVGIRELVVTGIHLPARPLLDPWCQRTYRSIALDGNSIAVVFALGVPVSVRIRRN